MSVVRLRKEEVLGLQDLSADSRTLVEGAVEPVRPALFSVGSKVRLGVATSSIEVDLSQHGGEWVVEAVYTRDPKLGELQTIPLTSAIAAIGWC